MIYRPYGRTGKEVSTIGFGAMRFGDIDNVETCVEMVVHAAERGITYFDTAPKYFGTRSEERIGEGLRELRRREMPYYLSSKTFESTESGVRREIEAQLKRLDVDAIDFYHMWCITDLSGWRERKENGVIEAFLKLKEEGLIRHICVSSHLIGDEIKELLDEEVFEGVLFGYSAYNYRTRVAAFDAIKQRNLGCVVMNPLGGGLIPQNPDMFKFIRTDENETIVQAALRFLIAHQEITVSLVGFGEKSHIDEAVDAVENFPILGEPELEKIKEAGSASFEGVCTGCQYCLEGCPEEIRIPQLMDAYNQLILRGENELIGRLKYHWHVPFDEAAKCIECGRCEDACTQHLNIIERLAEIVEIGARAE